MAREIRFVLTEKDGEWVCKSRYGSEILTTAGDTPNEAVDRMKMYRRRMLEIIDHTAGKCDPATCPECVEHAETRGLLGGLAHV